MMMTIGDHDDCNDDDIANDNGKGCGQENCLNVGRCPEYQTNFSYLYICLQNTKLTFSYPFLFVARKPNNILKFVGRVQSKYFHVPIYLPPE